jgi:hypothetical protein
MRLKRSAGDEDAYVKIAVLRELFALDHHLDPVEGDEAPVSDLRDHQRRRSGR